jgi:cytochrome c peroxidase
MRQRIKRARLSITAIAAGVAMLAAAISVKAQSGRYGPERTWWDAGQGGYISWDESYENPDGQVTIVNKKGSVQTKDHPFFEPLGGNGRACVTCHQPASAMSVSAASLRERWRETDGRDPIFAAVDGSNCPDLPQQTAASHSLLLERGLFRISLPWPPKTAGGDAIRPEFAIEVVHDPTGCNTSPVYGLRGARPSVSVYRRPRVAANLDQLSTGREGVRFMADGREPSLESQATSAILIHEQADKPPSAEQLRRIVTFETQLYAAQGADVRGGLLDEPSAPIILGPRSLASGKAPGLAGAAEQMSRMFNAWRKPGGAPDMGLQLEFRASVARGGDVFFARRFRYRSATFTCATCHDAGLTRWMDIGTTTAAGANDAPDLPMFRITCEASAGPHPVFGRLIYTHDPGRALISGKCADVGSIVLGQIRGLAARAPYFSSGSARSLRDLIDFYDRRFEIGYTEMEKQDLENFLRVL